MDFIRGRPKTKKGDTIFVVIDCLSKCNHLMPLHHPYTTKEVAEVFGPHRYPQSIVSDQNNIFIGLSCFEIWVPL